MSIIVIPWWSQASLTIHGTTIKRLPPIQLDTTGQARLALHQDARQPWNGRVGWNRWAQAFLRRCIGFWAAFRGFQMPIMAIMKLCMLFCWIRCRPCCWFYIYVWACLSHWVRWSARPQKNTLSFGRKKREHEEFYNAGKTIIKQ